MERLSDIVKKNKNLILAVTVIFLFSLVSLRWFGGDYRLGNGDSFQSVYMARYLESLDSSWDGVKNTGNPALDLATLLPSGIIYLPLEYLNVDPVVAEKIWVISTLFLPGLFMYLFVKEFFGSKVPEIVCISVSLFYIFNPLNMLFDLGNATAKYPIYLALPLMAYLLLKIFSSESWVVKIKYALLMSVSTILLSASLINIAQLVPIIFVLISIFILKMIEVREKFRHSILVATSALLFFLINAWVFLGPFYSQYQTKEQLARIVSDFSVGGTRVFDALRLFGFWALRDTDQGISYFPFGEHYYAPSSVFFTYILVFLALLPLILYHFWEFSRRKILLAIFLFLSGIFLVKGIVPPFGGWFESLLNNFAILRTFREPYAKFSMITLFSYVLLIAYSLTFLSEKLNKKFKYGTWVISGLFVILVSYISYPMFTGEIVGNITHNKRKQTRVIVPEYWEELYDYTHGKDIKGRVLTNPNTWYYVKSFVWPSGFTGFPFELYMDADFVYRRTGMELNNGDLLANILYDAIYLYNTEGNPVHMSTFVNTARIMNVTHILQMNDFDILSYGESFLPYYPDEMDNFYNSTEEIFVKEKSFGAMSEDYLRSIPHISGGDNVYRFQGDPTTADYLSVMRDRSGLDLYKMDDLFIMGKIYIPDKIIGTTQPGDMITRLGDGNLMFDKPLFIQGSNASGLSLYDKKLEYEEISESKYWVRTISEFDHPYPIVFSETFDKGWKLAKNCGTLGCSGIVDKNHFMANYFANGWLIDPSEMGNEFFIVHDSAARLKNGIVISTVTLVGSLWYVFFGKKVPFVKEKKTDGKSKKK